MSIKQRNLQRSLRSYFTMCFLTHPTIRTSATRVPDGEYHNLNPGEYQYAFITQSEILHGNPPEWRWILYPPGGRPGYLSAHYVVQHTDGTISVFPSVKQPHGWHGWLIKGVWEQYDED